MNTNLIMMGLVAAAGYFIYKEKQASDYYGVPMFSEQLRLVAEQDTRDDVNFATVTDTQPWSWKSGGSDKVGYLFQ